MVIAQQARFVIYESGTGSHLGSLEFHYHELLSHDAVSAALEVADQKHEAQNEPIKMVETDLTYDKMQKMSTSEARAAQLRDPKGWRLAFARERRRENKRHAPIWNARRMWTRHATDDESRIAEQVADEFAKRTPAFARTEAKAVKIAN